jgi:hypothetical protein
MGKEPTPSATHTVGAREAFLEHLALRGLRERHGVTKGTLIFMRSTMAWAGKPQANGIAPAGANGKATRPRERRERRTTSASSTSSGGDGSSDEPPPLSLAAERLLYDLVATGLDDTAFEAAAALVLALDEDARREREAMA